MYTYAFECAGSDRSGGRATAPETPRFESLSLRFATG